MGGVLQNPGHSRTNVSDRLWQRAFGTPQKSDNRLVMSRRLGGVPKARGHIQGGKSYKTGVLQHPIALQRSDCQSHVKRAKGTSLRPDRIICKLIALRHVPTPGHINLPKKIGSADFPGGQTLSQE